MCRKCFGARATKPQTGICSRCGHEGTCWIRERRNRQSKWPMWKVEWICYVCIAHASIAA